MIYGSKIKQGKDGKYHYVYRITNIVENKHYYGKRSSSINPYNDLGTKYFSSSRDFSFLQEQKLNKNNFKYKVILCFSSSQEAVAFESKLHKKFNVSVNKSFYNKVNQTSSGFDTTGSNYNKGTVSVKDSEGKYYRVPIDDPRYLSGELVHTSKNTVMVKDSEGNIFQVSNEDERYLSGELVFIFKGTFVVTDKEGNKFRITKEDPRYLSGELVPISKNREVSEETKIKLSKANLGRKHNKETIDKIKKKNSGFNSWSSRHKYYTPLGEGYTKYFLEPNISGTTVYNFCLNADKKISKKSYAHSKWLQENFSWEYLKDKTYRDIGFYTEPTK